VKHLGEDVPGSANADEVILLYLEAFPDCVRVSPAELALAIAKKSTPGLFF